MVAHNSHSNNKSHSNILKYKICAGKLCDRIGNNRMKIRYVNRIAWFCDRCKGELIDLELIVQGEDVYLDSKKTLTNVDEVLRDDS